LRRDLGRLPSYVHRHGRRTRRDLGCLTDRCSFYWATRSRPCSDPHITPLPAASPGGIATRPEQRRARTRNTEQGHQFGSTPRARERWEAEKQWPGDLSGGGGGQRGATRRRAATGGVRPGSRGVGSRHGSSEKSGDERKREAMAILENRGEWRGFM
jgi:hypothetical protein